jgi:hypothetical protein
MPVRTDVDNRITAAIGPALTTFATNTTVKGAAIDLAGVPGARVFGLAFTGARTDGTYTFTLQENDVDVDGSPTTLAIASGSLAAIAAATTVRKFSAVPTKRFVRLIVASTAVTTGAVAGGLLMVLGAGQV